MREFTFSIDLDSEQVRNIMYGGTVRRVQVMTDQWLRIELPISHFQSFVSYSGLHGHFLLTLDGSRFVSLQKID